MKSLPGLLAVLILAVAGCGAPDSNAGTQTSATPEASGTRSANGSDGEASPQTTPLASSDQHSIDPEKRKPANGDPVAVIDTDLGQIVLMFFPDKAPAHVANFEGLAERKFYDGTKFHRTIPGFMIQGGDPNTKGGDQANWGLGGPGYTIKNEFNDVHHARGIMSMARSQDPDSAGSQFFIMVADVGRLDGQYTAFGKVVSGIEVADKIVALPSEPGSGKARQPVTVKSIRIEKWPAK